MCYTHHMRKHFLFSIIFLVILAVPVSSDAAELKYAAWLPYWTKTNGAVEAEVNLDKMTELSPFAYEIRAGKITDTMKLTEAPWPDLLAKARAKGVKIIPSVMWADAGAIHSKLSDTAERISSVREILAIVDQNNFDGIDVDFEAKSSKTIDFFSRFLKGLSNSLHARGKILSCTIESRTPVNSAYSSASTIPDKINYANDYVVINKYCDRVRIMTYDQMAIDKKLNKLKRQTGPYAPVADVAWVRKIVGEAVKTIAPSKIYVGLANYGYHYTVKAVEDYYEYKNLGSLSSEAALKLAAEVGKTPTRNLAGELSFTFAKDNQMHIVWWSDAQAMLDKVRVAKANGLGGVALFRLDGRNADFWAQVPLR